MASWKRKNVSGDDLKAEEELESKLIGIVFLYPILYSVRQVESIAVTCRNKRISIRQDRLGGSCTTQLLDHGRKLNPAAFANTGDENNGPWRTVVAPLPAMPQQQPMMGRCTAPGKEVRQKLVDYYANVGAVEWQDAAIGTMKYEKCENIFEICLCTVVSALSTITVTCFC
uniref:Uncharacterized protein n=1 Tax=Ditylenchus dipsaci TaxID=166011 RepID=A0A915EVW3_9BILA